jgi:L-fucose isomerase-like protein
MTRQTTFALFFGNRGFFPESLIAGARDELAKAVGEAGYGFLMPPADLTRYGAVETREEGRRYAAWLAEHKGAYDGVILCLPNFGDENGAIVALQDCGVPILVQAYPDEAGKMDSEHRRDSYCGKFSIADVFHQYGLPFTMLAPHVVHPLTPAFARNLTDFAAICRVANGMRRFSIGAIGARTTPFKTVRFDEITLQKKGITIETFDLSDLIRRVRGMDGADARVKAKVEQLAAYTNCGGVPAAKMETLAKLGAVLDAYVEEYGLDAVALRCWEELQKELGVSPCLLLSELNERGIVGACEVDVCSAITMRALNLASGKPATCLDWNNNYGDDPDKVILFHCGPVPQSLMEGKGKVGDHKIIAKNNPGCGWGCNEGRMAAFPTTLSNCKTEDGKLSFYLAEGRFTGEPIEAAFFGCAGVCEIPDLQTKVIRMGQGGFRHHTTVGVGHLKAPMEEAFRYYLGYDIVDIG